MAAIATRRLALPLLLAVAVAERHFVGRPHLDARAPRDAAASWVASRRPRRARQLLAAAALAGAGAAHGQEVVETPSQQHYRMFDTNADGTVDRAEYIAFAQKALDERQAADVVQKSIRDFYNRLFTTADVDGDGVMSPGEFEYGELLHTFAAKARLKNDADPEEMPEDEFNMRFSEAALKEADNNGDGVIDRGEYDAAMRLTLSAWGLDRYLDHPEVTGWLDEMFAKGDLTGDGLMNVKEVQFTAFSADDVLSSGKFYAKRWAASWMDEHDTNKNGKIEPGEVSKFDEGDAEGGGAEEEDHISRMFTDSIRERMSSSGGDADEAMDAAQVAEHVAAFIAEL